MLVRLPSRLSLVALATLATTACSGSAEPAPDLGSEFDVAGLSADVFRLCETTQCSDYSEYECKFYLRYDTLEYARFSEDPQACFATMHAEITCLAEAGNCGEESCYGSSEDACQLVTEAPNVEFPEILAPAQAACEFRADCDADLFDEDYGRNESIAECRIEYITRTELFQHDQGSACADAFITFLSCIGNSNIECSASAEDEEAACPAEVASFEARCFDEG
ncbi:MAG: hypothetical protein AAF436_16530 [Myxococcota bacterium]